MDSDLEVKLTEEFSVFGFKTATPMIMAKCLEICYAYNLTAETFVEQWVTYSISARIQGGLQLTLDDLSNFERKTFTNSDRIVVKQEKDSNITVTNRPTISQIEADTILNTYNESSTTPKIDQSSKRKRIQLDQVVDNDSIGTLTLGESSQYDSICSLSESYQDRKDIGKVLESFGPKTLMEKALFRNKDIFDKLTIKQWGNEENLLRSNAMINYEVITSKANSLNSTTEWIGRYLFQKRSLPPPDAYFIPYSSTNSTTYGRIFNADKGHLKKGSVSLESSQEFGAGQTISLELYKLNQFSLFPGQIVAVDASSSKVDSLLVSNIYSDAMLELPKELPKFSTAGPLEIIVASGPFTVCYNFTYEPLLDLIAYVVEHKPHVVILLGPFVDIKHESIANGMFGETYDSQFQALVDAIMQPLTSKCSSTQVVIVPSYKDAHHHNVYPTPPYSLDGHYPNLHFMPDPCVIDINGLTIGVTSADVLFHLGKEELFWSGVQVPLDRMARLAKHVLSQQCFYPIYPPDEEMCVDHHLLERYGSLEITPHILVLPSTLRYFIKNIDGCMVVNPERLSKGYVGGTFARMEIYPDQTTSSIVNNVVCQIIKI